MIVSRLRGLTVEPIKYLFRWQENGIKIGNIYR